MSFELNAGEEIYIKIQAIYASCILSAKILAAGATYTISSTVDSEDFFELESTVHNDIQWELIKIDEIEYAELDEDIKSLYFKAPNVLYIKNTSTTQSIRFSLRGNR